MLNAPRSLDSLFDKDRPLEKVRSFPLLVHTSLHRFRILEKMISYEQKNIKSKKSYFRKKPQMARLNIDKLNGGPIIELKESLVSAKEVVSGDT